MFAPILIFFDGFRKVIAKEISLHAVSPAAAVIARISFDVTITYKVRWESKELQDGAGPEMLARPG